MTLWEKGLCFSYKVHLVALVLLRLGGEREIHFTVREKGEREKEREEVVRGKGGLRNVSGFTMSYERGGVL